MAERTISMSKWVREAERLATEGRPFRMNGPSPGGAAAELGITRQAVHKAIKEGRLDAWRVVADGDKDRLVSIIVTGESLERRKAELALTA